MLMKYRAGYVVMRTINQLPVKRHMAGKQATCVKHFFTFPVFANALSLRAREGIQL